MFCCENSVASAIDFLYDEVNLPDFQGSEATTHFITMVDMAFDMLNSRYPLATGYEASVTKEKLGCKVK